MKEPNTYEPTESELEILQILWKNEPATVRFVFEQINLNREVGYTTILKQMQRLAEKNILSRDRQGKTHYYSVVPQQATIEKNMFQRFVNTVFQGSSMKLVMHALGQEQTSAEEIEAIQAWLDQKKKSKND